MLSFKGKTKMSIDLLHWWEIISGIKLRHITSPQKHKNIKLHYVLKKWDLFAVMFFF